MKSITSCHFSIQGFSLVELLVVLTILGILVAMSYPNYIDYLTRARRYDGQSALLHLAVEMEEYYTTHHTYETATLNTGRPSDVQMSAVSTEGWYTLGILEQTASSYRLQAIPRKSQGKRDRLCQGLVLDSTNKKEITAGPMGQPQGLSTQCW